MNPPETKSLIEPFGGGEVLFLGSLPFLDFESAERWLDSFPLTVSFRIQLPQKGSGFDMVSEVERVLESPRIRAGTVASKDQLIGYLSFLGMVSESKENLRRYEEQLEVLLAREDALPQRRIFCFDEPAIGMGFALENNYLVRYRDLAARLRRSGILCAIHCCQTPLNAEATLVFEEDCWDLISLPLRREHQEIFTSAYRRGISCCWGLSPQQLVTPFQEAQEFFDHFTKDLRMTPGELMARTSISSECGLGLLSEAEARRQTSALYEVAGMLRGLSRT